jgi:transposase
LDDTVHEGSNQSSNKNNQPKELVMEQQLHAAVDLHGDNGHYGICDQDGKRVFGKRLPNDLPTVLEALKPFRDRLTQPIAVESTFNWYWLADGLMEAGYAVALVNPARVDSYDGLKRSDDCREAFHLAELQRLGLLPTGYLYPKAQRGVRDLLRRRMLLVRQRTMQMLSLQSLVQRQTGQRISANRIRGLTPDELPQWVGNDRHAVQMGEISRQVMVFLQGQIAQIEKEVLSVAEATADFERLQTLPGVGKILGLTILLETGEIRRFADAGHYTSYSRGCSASRYSNGKKKGQNNRKNGNRYLSWAFVEAAVFAIRHDERARAWHQRKLARCGGNKVLAIKALAAKLSKAAYYVLARQEAFDPSKMWG